MLDKIVKSISKALKACPGDPKWDKWARSFIDNEDIPDSEVWNLKLELDIQFLPYAQKEDFLSNESIILLIRSFSVSLVLDWILSEDKVLGRRTKEESIPFMIKFHTKEINELLKLLKC